MKTGKVELLPSAQADIGQALAYLLEKDAQAAIAFLDDVERAANQLRSFPETAPIARDKRLAKEGYRVMLLQYSYLLFYRMHDETVYIYRVVDGKRNYGAFI